MKRKNIIKIIETNNATAKPPVGSQTKLTSAFVVNNLTPRIDIIIETTHTTEKPI